MNFLTTAFGILFMVGFLYGAGQAMREDSATKVARYKRMADDAATRNSKVEPTIEAQQAAVGVGVPGTVRPKR